VSAFEDLHEGTLQRREMWGKTRDAPPVSRQGGTAESRLDGLPEQRWDRSARVGIAR
jgi:hypothetical protein